LTYISGDSRSAAKAIVRFINRSADLQIQAQDKSGGVENMENHFRSLFALYANELEESRAA
jgi:hypothetical protein